METLLQDVETGDITDTTGTTVGNDFDEVADDNRW